MIASQPSGVLGCSDVAAIVASAFGWSDAANVAAVLLSLGALLFAGATLYLTSLQAATVDADLIEPLPVDGWSWTNDGIVMTKIWLGVFFSNAGARGGLLESLKMTVDSLPPLWNGVTDNPDTVYEGLGRGDRLLVPRPLAAGEGVTAFFFTELVRASSEIEEQARQLALIDVLPVTVEWTYLRASRRLWWRSTYGRKRVPRSQRFEIDLSRHRETAVSRMRVRKEWFHLVELYETARSEAASK